MLEKYLREVLIYIHFGLKKFKANVIYNERYYKRCNYIFNFECSFYKALRCEIVGSKEEKDGVIITPMRYIIKE